jgi:hypothetical protein
MIVAELVSFRNTYCATPRSLVVAVAFSEVAPALVSSRMPLN